ncbi:MAG TPA: YSC84-related protein [Puia sp.]|jgi:lipid-binding SYLF domain-containing protein|nr:YSC84-related protein [Puia sp.]
MKKYKIITVASLVFSLLFFPRLIKAQDDKEKILIDCKNAKAIFMKTDASMSNLFMNAYGYAIFPDVGKGGAIVGGAGGGGALYEKGKAIGTAKMVQVDVGAQVGGQTYREVIFFENKDAFDRFKENKIEFSGQASAVAVKSGASANVKYREGVAVYTQEISGLMLEASLGGQKFTYTSF